MDIFNSVIVWLIGLSFMIILFPVTFIIWLIVLPFDRGNEESKIEMLEKSYKCLKRGYSVMMFPEGTRSADKEIGFFKRGAFQLAIQADVPILPVLIDGTGGILPKHGLIFGSGYHIRLRVLDPVQPASFGTSDPDELAKKFSSLFVSRLKVLRVKTDTL